ncbi:hypothetical protein [Haloarcula nitratireducens]|nr:hypothetical protein [Halomicroarcula nitratireducens]
MTTPRVVNRLGVTWFERAPLSSSRDGKAVSNDPEALGLLRL